MRLKSCLVSFASVPLLLCGASLTAQTTTTDNFSYNGDLGPGFWYTIAPACAPSPVSRQSPIDIDDVKEDPGLEALHLVIPETTYTQRNTGYTVNVAPTDAGVLVYRHEVYTLLQFHFHTLAEHTVEGRRGDMELHAVFQNEHNGHKEFVVVGVVFKIGRPNAQLEKLIEAGIPQLKDQVSDKLGRLNLNAVFTDISSYYTYAGSLTTPSCSENVRWIVLKHWAELSPEQFEAFRHVLGNDFRPLQERNGRVIHATVK